MSWFCVEITEACVLGGAYHRLCRQFQQAFIAAGAPADVALFAQTSPLGDTRKVYFSPGSLPHVRALVEAYDGYACDPPEGDEVTLVFGVPGAKMQLLPPLDVVSAEGDFGGQPALLASPVGASLVGAASGA